MKFYKTICEKEQLKCFSVDGEFFNSSSVDLFQSKLQDDVSVYWNKKSNAIVKDSIDFMDIFNFYRAGDSLLNLPSIYSSKSINRYMEFKEKILSIFRSYKQINIDFSNYEIYDLIPTRIMKEFLVAETLVLKDANEFLQSKEWYDVVLKFFKDRSKTNVLKDLHFPILTTWGRQDINLVWQANFRFKSMKGSFNLFNMPKTSRDVVIPQSENDIIYCADFRQFEIRTFCKLHPELEVDFENRELYAEFAKLTGLETDVAKEQIIAYIYGQINPKLDIIADRKLILDFVKDDFYSWQGYPVILREQDNDKIRIHTIVQTISQYIYLEKLEKILELLKDKRSKFIFPLHDSIIVSLNKDEMDLIPQMVSILEDETYKVKQYMGDNLRDLEVING